MADAADEYYLLIGEETRGPFTLAQLHEQWHAGTLARDALFLQKGKPGVSPIDQILERIIAFRPPEKSPPTETPREQTDSPSPKSSLPPEPAEPPAPQSVPAKSSTRKKAAPNYTLRLAIGAIVCLALIWKFNPARPKPPPEHVLHARVEVSAVEFRVENLSLFDWTNVVVRLEGNSPDAFQARIGNLAAGASTKMPLTSFADATGKRFEPWKSTVSEIWLGGDAYEFRKFPFARK